jgi:hypothetical protein
MAGIVRVMRNEGEKLSSLIGRIVESRRIGVGYVELHRYSSKESHEVTRKLVQIKTDKDGLFVQPDLGDSNDKWAERELVENHNRLGFAHVANFADQYTGNTRTFDPAGNYVCGQCNKHEDETESVRCLLMAKKFKIDEDSGSCRYWENLCAGDPELDFASGASDGIYAPKEAYYGVARKAEGRDGLGFGCHRCGMQEEAVQPDSRGRTLYCKRGDFRTFSNACCALNNAPTD